MKAREDSSSKRNTKKVLSVVRSDTKEKPCGNSNADPFLEELLERLDWEVESYSTHYY